MSIPLLTTKFHIPPARVDLVPRPQLIERLNDGLEGKLILISAPAGFGKTTILSSWIDQSDLPFGWVSLDEDDNAPTRFLTYLIAGLQTITPNIGETILPALQSPQSPPPLSILPFLINDLSACEEMVLVLDDYHVIKTQTVHDIVEYLLQHMPRNLHLVIATRADPPLPLPRLRGRQQLTELRTADLRFSQEEAKAFFNQIRNLSLSIQDVNALNARTEGWITGLQMADLSMRGYDDKSQFIQSFTGSNRYILDYLLEEVLAHQTEEIRDFLLKTSILEQLSGSLCQALTGEVHSQQMLEDLERANLFMIPLDDRRGWFRYHHLFADLLRQRLAQTAPASVPEMQQRASIWYEENGFLGEAIDQALAIEDYKRTVRLLKQYIQSIWEYGDQTRLSKWLSSLPEDEICKQPIILTHHAFALCFSGQFDTAEEQLVLAEKNINTDHALFQGMAATVRAYYSLYSNEIDAAADYARFALEHLPSGHHMWRSLALSIHGDVHAFYGHVPTCEEIWGNALHEAEKGGNLFFALLASAKVVVAQKRLGRLQQAAKTFEEQTRRAFESGYTQMAVAGALYAVFGDILLEWNRVDEAIEHIQHGLTLSERQNYVAGIAWSCISMIHARFSQADLDAAEGALRQLDERIQRQNLPAWTLDWFTAWKARLLIAHSDLEGAGNVLQERGITLDGEFGYPNEVEYLALARLLMAKRNFSEAENLLIRLQEHLNSKGWIDKIIEVQILQALIYQEKGRDDLALGLVATALSSAQPEGYSRVFVNEGPAMARLLYKALQANIAPDYVRKLLAAFRSGTRYADESPGDRLIEPLSEREIEVLRLLATELTGPEIAQELVIAISTLRSHTQQIYRKLGVTNRRAALKSAQELQLL